jgi:hypothetical protein
MARAAAGRMVVAWGECLPLARALPLLPVISALDGLARLDEGRVLAVGEYAFYRATPLLTCPWPGWTTLALLAHAFLAALAATQADDPNPSDDRLIPADLPRNPPAPRRLPAAARIPAAAAYPYHNSAQVRGYLSTVGGIHASTTVPGSCREVGTWRYVHYHGPRMPA